MKSYLLQCPDDEPPSFVRPAFTPKLKPRAMPTNLETHLRMRDYDQALRIKHGPFICGVDEVGRGAVAGPICAGAVILPPDITLPGLKDSKKMTPEQREKLATEIKEVAIAWHIASVEAPDIDTGGLTWANQEVMRKAAQGCADTVHFPVNLYVVDEAPKFPLNPHIMMSKADSISLSVAAAAVIAKTFRDALMSGLAVLHPEYDWDLRHGYVSAIHVEGIRKYGMVDGLHRKSYHIRALDKTKQMSLEDLF